MKMISPKQIPAIWASARDHCIDKQSVYDIIAAVSGKESMKALTESEAYQVLDRIKGRTASSGYAQAGQKRTDEGGNEATVKLRRKIYHLTGELGWNNNNDRINGFIKKLCGVERIEWLTVSQCHKAIEALKKMVQRGYDETAAAQDG